MSLRSVYHFLKIKKLTYSLFPDILALNDSDLPTLGDKVWQMAHDESVTHSSSYGSKADTQTSANNLPISTYQSVVPSSAQTNSSYLPTLFRSTNASQVQTSMIIPNTEPVLPVDVSQDVDLYADLPPQQSACPPQGPSASTYQTTPLPPLVSQITQPSFATYSRPTQGMSTIPHTGSATMSSSTYTTNSTHTSHNSGPGVLSPCLTLGPLDLWLHSRMERLF